MDALRRKIDRMREIQADDLAGVTLEEFNIDDKIKTEDYRQQAFYGQKEANELLT